MAGIPRALAWALLAWLPWASACDLGDERITLSPLPDEGPAPASPPDFACESESSVECIGTTHFSCRRVFEFLQIEEVDCGERGEICDVDLVCVTCRPGETRCSSCSRAEVEAGTCDTNRVQRCNDEGTAWVDDALCDVREGNVCRGGMCRNQCDLAEQTYVGCVFYAVDLDNAAIDALHDASSQQYAVAVANPQPFEVTVTVEINNAPYGRSPATEELERRVIPPGFLEVFELPRREVDGSTDNGLNDGTHTALTSNAFRIEATHPVTAYQFNPLENVSVFSNDASLLLPTTALGNEYTVVSWPQTIGNSDNPDLDFDPTSSDDDLRAFLTIVGTTDDTSVEVQLGDDVVRVAGGSRIAPSGPNDLIRLDVGPFDVINLETAATEGDFTGTVVTANAPVAVFVGSEASDVPLFADFATRQCCADHLEEQLFPNRTLGTNFAIAKMPLRSRALNEAAAVGVSLGIAESIEDERVRIVAAREGTTTIRTTLPFPDNEFRLTYLQDLILKVETDFMIEADQSIAVLQALPSQDVTGIPPQYPGGDPAIVALPPMEQYRRDYIFLTPDKYAFDFVVITAPEGAEIELDGRSVPDDWGCSTSPADGLSRPEGERPDQVVHRCQLSFPEVPVAPGEPRPGVQNDGVHTLVSNAEVGVVVYGFDRFVSYAYAAGLNLLTLQ